MLGVLPCLWIGDLTQKAGVALDSEKGVVSAHTARSTRAVLTSVI